jgi:hypothetical protein
MILPALIETACILAGTLLTCGIWIKEELKR